MFSKTNPILYLVQRNMQSTKPICSFVYANNIYFIKNLIFQKRQNK